MCNVNLEQKQILVYNDKTLEELAKGNPTKETMEGIAREETVKGARERPIQRDFQWRLRRMK